MQKTCRQCQTQFEITDQDLAFYHKISPIFNGKKFAIPAPTLCPDCRQQRRISFRNFSHLYQRKCDATGQQIISMYAPGNFTVYDLNYWNSDKWSAFDYGVGPDFQQNFLDQYFDLVKKVPKYAVYNILSENCLYSNMVRGSKNCYLIFGCINDEDCMFGHIVWESKNCFDCSYVLSCELCYECVDCLSCYSLKYSQDCNNCSESQYLHNCKNVSNSFGCVGLKDSKYCMFNVQYSKEEYDQKLYQLSLSNSEIQNMMTSLRAQKPVMYFHGMNNENSFGDYCYNSKNLVSCFDVKNSEDVRYGYTLNHYKDSYDVTYSGVAAELCYETLFIQGYGIYFSQNCLNQNARLYYCDSCSSCQDCFGCVGLRQAQYCILNKQYTKEEYELLVDKIVGMMIEGKQWGEFLDMKYSPFAYNETMAHEYFPLSKEQAVSQGLRWKEEDTSSQYQGVAYQIPWDIREVKDDICQAILQCEVSNKPYKITKQELSFYKTMNIPIPRKSPDQRHSERMSLRNPRKLWDLQCVKCGIDLETSYSAERSEVVYCEKCYLKEMY